MTTDEREEKYEDADEEENEDGSKSALVNQVCAYLTTGQYKVSYDKNKKWMILKKAQRFTMIEGSASLQDDEKKEGIKFCNCIPVYI